VILPHEIKWLKACQSLAPIFSTCSKRQYASFIIATNKRVIGFGYNGSPPGMPHCTDGHCPRLHEDSASGSAYDNCISQHAEAGALLWSDPSMRIGATLIVNGTPCMGCAKLIASSGVIRVVCINDGNYVQWPLVKQFFADAKIEIVEHDIQL
jgi:dCMP deaminase